MTQIKNSVSLNDILSSITDKTFTLLPNGRTTVCQLTIYNKFTVEGQSACVSIENYNKEKGEQIAFDNAVNACWPLFGFLLAENLYRTSLPDTRSALDRANDELLQLSERIVALHNFIYNDNPVYASRPDEEKERLASQLNYMCGYRELLSERIDNWQP